MSPRSGAPLALVLIALAVTGCGGSELSKQDKTFYDNVNTQCSQLLQKVTGAADTNTPNAPHDDILAQAQRALANASRQVLGMSAPASQRAAQRDLAAALDSSSGAIGRYLQDKQTNEAATSGDYNTIVADLSALQQTASTSHAKACAIPVE